MNKLQIKEAELDRAINGIENASASVKQLSVGVKNGLVPRSKLTAAMEDLKKKGGALKILHAEAKILSGYDVVTFAEIAPKTNNNNIIWALISIIALGYLATH